MINFLERMGIVKKEDSHHDKTGPAVIMVLLMAAFVGTTFYILFSSLD